MSDHREAWLRKCQELADCRAVLDDALAVSAGIEAELTAARERIAKLEKTNDRIAKLERALEEIAERLAGNDSFLGTVLAEALGDVREGEAT